MTNFLGEAFYGFKDPARFQSGLQALVDSVESVGVFVADNLVTWSKGLGFLDDARLIEIVQRHSETLEEGSLIWRTAVLIWAGKRALRRSGDFVEAGAYRGTTARILCDYFGFAALDRRYFLYDLFDLAPDTGQLALPHHSMSLHGQVVARFADLPNVTIVKGALPGSLAVAAPAQIAFLHVDLNHAAAERGVLEVLYDRVADGAVIVLDDYGWAKYSAQRLTADAFFATRDNPVLELPTGQGLVIK